MDIISKLHFQLSKIKNILVQEVKIGEYSYNYLICEDSCKFLDKNALQTYLTAARSITNFTFLTSINQLCIDIIRISNEELPKISEKVFEEHFKVSYNDIFLSTPNSFHAIYVYEDKLEMFTSLLDKEEFIKNYEYKNRDVIWIADRCRLILSWIGKSYPNTKPEEIKKVNSECFNPYPNVFKDYYSFKLFERLFNEYKDGNTLLADFSFIYRKMSAEGFILPYFKPELFKQWLSTKSWNILLDSGLKTIDRCKTKGKESNYNNIKEIVKIGIT